MGVSILNILVLVAHSDDEVLGCGGVLVKHVEAGDNVFLIVVADGVSSRKENNKEKRDQALHRKIGRASCRERVLRLV